MLSRNPTDEPMQIVLPPELEALVQQELDTGRYDSAIDVLTKGVESLRQQDDIYQGRLEELRRDALVGWEELRRGEGVDGATAMAEIRAYAQNLKRDALVGWEAMQRGEVVDGETAVAEVLAYVQAKY
jgi:antitoxin ParD1/3/4